MAEAAAAAKEAEEEVPKTRDEAYEHYMRNADLLCAQLSDIQGKQDSIIKEAEEKAAAKLLAKEPETKALSRGMSREALIEAVAETNEEYMEINAQMRRELDEIRRSMPEEVDLSLIEKWKRQHRRSHT